MASTGRYYYHGPEDEGASVGFRIATVPEPAAISLFIFGTVGILIKRR